jgi:hypothetical protein
MLVNNVFEATRAAFGYKPNWGHLNSLSTEELQDELMRLSAAIEVSIQDEENQIAFETDLERQEKFLSIPGELTFTKGCWA